jgi:hypothetical protein
MCNSWQFVTLDSFQVFDNEHSNDKLPLKFGDGSRRKSIAAHYAEDILYEFVHVILIWAMVRGSGRHHPARPPDLLFRNTTISFKL